MQYISTRGGIAPIPFKEAVMMGLATDGGLLLPETIPAIDDKTIDSWQKLKYQELAYEVISLFVGDIFSSDLRTLIERSYASFTHPQITPLVRHNNLYILELFHGPTLAFKDVALQLLGNLFEYFLNQSGDRMNILGATSGDTGSAAIYGIRGKERINIFILHPHKRVSRIQELQMTTVTDANVFNLAIRGTFDDGQAIVKSIFNDIPFKEKHRLGAINSINWARILAQVVYYIYAYFRATDSAGTDQVDFSVPTGNFGDIFAGYIARAMLKGRIRRLVVATNENDLLTRFVLKGDYSAGKVVSTSSPSMDIQVASNFERYLYYLNNMDAEKTRQDFETFSKTGALRFDTALQKRIKQDFASKSVNESETANTIIKFYAEHGYLMDPHTAVGVNAALSLRERDIPMICLSTAHPAKFGEAVKMAIGREPDMPESLAELEDKESRCRVLDAETAGIKTFIEQHAL